ncbi:hypothetical protein [Rhodobacter calidifons]|uniref:hypothetical protein n=1 Tax=Rhodobacter calidifons TaxID=2715277 RepID=UPI001A98179C|nr:hypothetical protein [Rhodobacter calidifons]
MLERLLHLAESTPAGLERALSGLASPDCQWRASHPMNEMTGNAAAAARIWGPLQAAFPDIERRDSILVAGRYRQETLVAAIGHYCGTMKQDWLGIPATGKTVFLRYGEVWQIGPDCRAVQASVIWDILDVMRQAGYGRSAPREGSRGCGPARSPPTACG